MHAVDQHCDKAESVGQRRDDRLRDDRRAFHLRGDRRQEERQPVITRDDEDVDGRQQQSFRIRQPPDNAAPERVLAGGQDFAALSLQFAHDPSLFVFGQPLRFRRPVGQIKQRHDAEYDRRNAFKDEDPSPSFPSAPIDALHNQSGDRHANHRSDRYADHKKRFGFGAVFIAKPVRQKNDYAREVSGFGQTQDEAQNVELILVAGEIHPWLADKSHYRGYDSPRDHDARDPFPRAPPFDDQRARDFEQEIAEKENTRARADDVVGEPHPAFAEGLFHLQGGDADVGTVNVRQKIEPQKKRH